MSTLHPHWQNTDDEDEDEQPVSVRIHEPKPGPHIPRAHRSPAAFIGMTLFVVVGVVVFNGTDFLWGQTQTPPAIHIRITQNAIIPPSFTATPGQKITWKNESDIPHILTSETMRDDRALPFESTAIFPNDTYTFTLPANSPLGTYEYVSRTSTVVTGEIVVQAQEASSSATTHVTVASSSVAAITQSSSAAAIPAAISSMAQQSSSAAPIQQIPEQVGGIPQNPYTVGNANGTTPTVPRGNSNVGSVTQHTPMSQPSTGTGAWVLTCIGIVSLWIVMKRAMRYT